MDNDINAEASQWKNKPYEPKQTWIFKRGDGEIIFAEEAQAWELLNPRGEWQRRDFELIGTSDFKQFHRMITEGDKEVTALKEKLNDVRAETKRYELTFEKMKFEDLLDDTDEKIIKVKAILKEKYKEIEQLLKQQTSIKSDIHQRALDAEMEIAKNNKNKPENQDILTPRGRRDEIMSSMRFN